MQGYIFAYHLFKISVIKALQWNMFKIVLLYLPQLKIFKSTSAVKSQTNSYYKDSSYKHVHFYGYCLLFRLAHFDMKNIIIKLTKTL